MNKRVVLGFLLLLVVYQASEGLQTVVAPGNPLGPALMLLALALAWPVGRWIDGSGWRAFGLLRPRWPGLLGGGLLLAILAKFARWGWASRRSHRWSRCRFRPWACWR